jgi:hypothetical protein
MQLKNETLNVLKNFSTINTNLVIKKGKGIETISPAKDIVASYKGDDEFSNAVSIFNLNEFLGVLGAFDKPDLTLDNKSMMIKQGKQKVNYIYADESLLVTPPAKGITFPVSDVQFNLNEETLVKLQKMAAILAAEDLSVIGDGKTITLKIFDKKNPSCNEFEIETDVATSLEFQVNFKIDKLKLLSGSYSVDISSKKISRFTHDSVSLIYYVAIEADSKFED